ncbi:MAG: xanthine dehydrogenase family protein molybdopterin-binding subunit [Acidimicrobiia bacterium]
MTSAVGKPQMFGARVRRVEDPRFLTGEGRYVADLARSDCLHAKFVRSTEAHARIVSVDVGESEGVAHVFTGADWEGLGIRCVSSYPGFRPTSMPVLAWDRVRYVGEAVAMVLAEDEYLAEDAMAAVQIEYEGLPPVVDLASALDADAPLVYDEWGDNGFVERRFTSEGFEEAFERAPHHVSGTWSMARHTGIPIETRAVMAEYDRGRDHLTVWTSTQIPHLIKTGLAQALGRDEASVRVVAPDVGGGFGVKAQLYPEEVACAKAAIETGHTVRWVEDRREHLLAAHHAREHLHHAEMGYDDEGRVLAYRVRIKVSMGPYSVFPWTSTMDTGMAMGILPGPYRIDQYSVHGTPVATNKTPFGAYRGVSRPMACFTTERMMDQVARERGLDPVELRRRNLLGSGDFPWNSVSGLVYDSGTVTECLDTLLEMADYPDLRRRQEEARARGDLVGIGVVPFIEQTAHTTREFVQRGVPIIFGYETSKLRFTPDGRLVISSSIHNHGQGLETTLAQMAADELGLDLDSIRVEFGDTDQVPYGSGTFASRSAVLAGGAARIAAGRLKEKLSRIAAHMLEARAEDIVFENGQVSVVGVPEAGMPLSELCRLVYQRPETLPQGEEPSLESVATYDADPGTGTYTSAAHLAVVTVDAGTGLITIDDYAVVEDCGRMINPMVVEGQIFGGVAQGIGGALLEEFLYDEEGRPLSTTFMDYLLPTFTEIPKIRAQHLETPSPITIGGVKGMGEGGAIAPGAVLAAALEDALAPLGHIVVDRLPLTPERVLNWIDEAKGADR